MSPTATPTASPAPAPAHEVPRPSSAPSGGGLAGAVRAEWTKLWSVRTPYVCLLAGILLTGVFTFYYGSVARINDKPVQPLGNAPVSSVVLGQFVVIVMAMAMVTGEAVAWAPFRGHASFDPGKAVSQTLAMGLYCALIAVLTVGASFALRSAVGTLSAVFALVSALPGICLGLGGPFLLAVHDGLPQTAGGHFMLADGDAPYPPAAGFLILLAWTAAAHLTGGFVLRRRDG
ncbi:ABC transporter permease [Streptomyces sp. NPDC056491]|uniref:ABC transporter permease n=1 Tax=Streptomyces sp. NPDC056491 TaxID=3345837 RepID=UPI0036A0D79F